MAELESITGSRNIDLNQRAEEILMSKSPLYLAVNYFNAVVY